MTPDDLSCPVCGLENAFPAAGEFHKCGRCGWYDDPTQRYHPNDEEGDNQPLSLNAARLNWKSGISVNEWFRQQYYKKLEAATNEKGVKPGEVPRPDAKSESESDTEEPE